MMDIRKLSLFSILTLLMAFSSTANVWAFDPFEDLQTNPPTGKTYSVLPVWYSTADYKTKFTLTNTSDTEGVAAFLNVMRGDEQLLYFFIFLLPNDSWAGEIRGETPMLWSEDDSALVTAYGDFASSERPLVQGFPVLDGPYDSGYVKVVEITKVPLNESADHTNLFFSYFFRNRSFQLHTIPFDDDFNQHPSSGVLDVCEEIVNVTTGETFSYCDETSISAPSSPVVDIDVEGTKVDISWTPSTWADGYRIYYSLTSSDLSWGVTKYVDVGNLTSISVNLTVGQDYYIRVQGYNSLGLGVSSSTHHIIPRYDSTSPTD